VDALWLLVGSMSIEEASLLQRAALHAALVDSSRLTVVDVLARP
jgi:hypothetical protein